tara:strand:- start:771 stop:890 length:120 start_codon:yes stop_codon:yes gene_type:complete
MAIQAKEYSELSPDESSLIELYDSAKKKINDELLIKMLE